MSSVPLSREGVALNKVDCSRGSECRHILSQGEASCSPDLFANMSLSFLSRAPYQLDGLAFHLLARRWLWIWSKHSMQYSFCRELPTYAGSSIGLPTVVDESRTP